MGPSDFIDETKFGIRASIREAAHSIDGPLNPGYFENKVEWPFELIVESYGCLAEASTQAGVSYLNPDREPEAYCAGTTDTSRRQEVIQKVSALAEGLGSVPSPADVHHHTDMGTWRMLEIFGSWHAILRESGIDPSRDGDVESVEECCRTIRQAALDLGDLPSKVFVNFRIDPSGADYSKWFEDWATAVEAAIGTAPNEWEIITSIFSDRPGVGDLRSASHRAHEIVRGSPRFAGDLVMRAPRAEIALVIEDLAQRLEHRPSAEEVIEYLPYHATVHVDIFGSVEAAIDAADVPETRDLTPTGSLTRQPKTTDAGEVPSHTDLLRDLRVVHVRGPSTIEADFGDRGVVNRRHFEIQFGSFEEAVKFYRGLDARHYREPRESSPAHFLQMSMEEFADLLDRPPLLEEFVAMSDYSLEELFELYEVDDEHESFLGDVRWSNTSLLDELTTVGEAVGHPPTPTECRELGEYPVECYLRRFGSWPAALAAVGVEVTPDIPEEYHAIELTKSTWRRTIKFVQTGLGSSPALKDDLWRLIAEFGGPPTRDAYARWGTHPLGVVEHGDEWTKTLAWAGIGATKETHHYQVDRERIEEVLLSLSEEISRELLPADVPLFSSVSIQTIIAEYGSLEAAFDSAGLPTSHFATPVTSVVDVWYDRHRDLMAYLEQLRHLAANVDRTLRYRDVREAEGVSTSKIYRYFRNFDEARRAARASYGLDGAAETTVDNDVSTEQLDPGAGILGRLVSDFEQ